MGRRKYYEKKVYFEYISHCEVTNRQNARKTCVHEKRKRYFPKRVSEVLMSGLGTKKNKAWRAPYMGKQSNIIKNLYFHFFFS